MVWRGDGLGAATLARKIAAHDLWSGGCWEEQLPTSLGKKLSQSKVAPGYFGVLVMGFNVVFQSADDGGWKVSGRQSGQKTEAGQRHFQRCRIAAQIFLRDF